LQLQCISGPSLFLVLVAKQADGQLLLVQLGTDSRTNTEGSTVYWQQLHAIAPAGSYLTVNNDNSFGVYYHGITARCIWTSASELSSGSYVSAPHRFFTASGAHELRLQVDGNLVAYDTATGCIVWQTGTSSIETPALHMTVQGNLVLTTATAVDHDDSSIVPLWQLSTHSAGAYMHIDDDVTTGFVDLYAKHEHAKTVSKQLAKPLVTAAYTIVDKLQNCQQYSSRHLAGISNSELLSGETIDAIDYDTKGTYTFVSPGESTTLNVTQNGFIDLFVNVNDRVWTASVPPLSNSVATATVEMNVSV
jgi:hypothetical protein